MPDAEERAGDGSCRTEVEECKRSCEPRVLHANLDGDGFDLRHIHTERFGDEEAECVAEEVVAYDDEHDEGARLDDAFRIR